MYMDIHGEGYPNFGAYAYDILQPLKS